MDLRSDARAIIDAGIDAVRPDNLMTAVFKREDSLLSIQSETYNLASYANIQLFGCGKASLQMAGCVEKILGPWLSEGLMVALTDEADSLRSKILESSHPVPTQKSLDAAKTIKDAMERMGSEDFFIFLLSGGTSAMLELPVEGLSLEDLAQTGEVLLASGMAIAQINTVRKHLSQIKGGRLGEKVKANGVVLVISDVIGDRLDTIGSAPLYCDTTTFAEAQEALTRSGALEKLPESVRSVLLRGAQGAIAETPKQPNPKIRHCLIGSNRVALEAAREKAEVLGYRAEVVSALQQGEAKDVAQTRVREIVDDTTAELPLCRLYGGETTVTMQQGGRGGRNQEFVLAALQALGDHPGICIASAGTDGIDGNTPAAGAIADAATFHLAKEKGISIEHYLKHHDSYNFFKITDDLIVTGPTGTNVMDLALLLKG